MIRNLLKTVILSVIAFVASSMCFAAIARVRDAADRKTCQERLKQLGIAVHNYASANRDALPGTTMANPKLTAERRFSWQVEIVPHLESTILPKLLDQKQAWDAEVNRFAALTGYGRMFLCPSFCPQPLTSTLVPTHYVGIAGVGADAADLKIDSRLAGILGHERTVYLSDVKDGLGFTILAAETLQVEGAWTAGGRPTVRGLESGRPYLGGAGQFGSDHYSSATNVLMADGSVRTLSRSINPKHFEALATMAGSDDIGSFPQD